MDTLLSGLLTGVVAQAAMTGSPVTLVIEIIILLLLIASSAFVSGSEVACFSLTPNHMEELQHRKGSRPAAILKLLAKPDRLLSTILVANNIINIAIIILAAFISSRLFNLSNNPVLSFIIEVVVITFILLLFCEIIPKVLASRNQLRFALMMAPALTFLTGLLKPIASLLSYSSFFVKRRARTRDSSLNIQDLSAALDLTSSEIKDDKEILRGVVRFGNTNTSAIMCPRIDVTALDISKGFHAIMEQVTESGFSRIPVYSGSFDNVRGILFVKDLLPHLGKPDNFRWQTLIRPPYVVPETKKISELLKEFQTKKIHMAIVVDEYGGTSGLVTLEDVLEEIVGEITDETDEEEPLYTKTDEGKWIFDGKILLNDFYRITGLEDDPFEDERGDSDTLAGLLLELLKEMPVRGRVISAGGFIFTIKTIENRRIREIAVEKKSKET
ncbi:MAG TPA: gliding motility-associated protein GldE [Bacteroidales bacterium]|nr:gliding motility-associated protein GldE [Bacteroidales bacterium]HNT93377.1 gliding motility-associated protein GldE [Bacteroidales bacterium]HOO66445.1 gliding motility-associated protein GldE [Bacteroidales bacterium]HPE22548.1 gliding motility-associated protein GldE [Bacteroidales bacterium]HPJ05373.1 gliding motility-associated protein GldE [Bacteroidales bacterium]